MIWTAKMSPLLIMTCFQRRPDQSTFLARRPAPFLARAFFVEPVSNFWFIT